MSDLAARLPELAALLLRAAAWNSLFAALLFAAVAVSRPFLRRSPPWIAHALWGLVLVRLLLPPGLSAPWGVGSLVVRGLPRPEAHALVDSWILAAGGEEAIGPRSAEGSRRPPAPPWSLPAVGLWVAGSGVGLAAFRRRRRRYRRLLERSAPVDDAHLLAALERWRRRLGMRRTVRLVSADANVAPFTLGLVRPTVFLPRGLLAGSRRRSAECVLAHELVHVARGDDLRLCCEAAVRALYFFHPLVWVTVGRRSEARERLCDARVLAAGGISRGTYGRSIVEVLRLSLEGVPHAPAFGDAKRRAEMRIREILDTRPIHRGRSFGAALAFLAAAAFLLPMAARSAGAAEGEAAPAAPAPWQNPLPGARVTSPFGPRADPFGKAPGARLDHRGIDVAAKPGTPVLAAAAGKVEVATKRYAGGAHHGTVVVVDHGGGFETFYAHLGSLAVHEGQQVAAGQVLGTAGSTGEVTGPHLHFELWRNGTPVDPAAYVADWRGGDERP